MPSAGQDHTPTPVTYFDKLSSANQLLAWGRFTQHVNYMKQIFIHHNRNRVSPATHPSLLFYFNTILHTFSCFMPHFCTFRYQLFSDTVLEHSLFAIVCFCTGCVTMLFCFLIILPSFIAHLHFTLSFCFVFNQRLWLFSFMLGSETKCSHWFLSA